MIAWLLDKLRDAWWSFDRRHHIRAMECREAVEKEFHAESEFKVITI